MRMVIVAIRDVKADNYARPWFVQTVAVAMRSFADEVNREDKENQLNTHSEDFQLWEIGIYDDNDGKIYGKETPKLIASGDQVKTVQSIRQQGIHAV